MKDNNIYSKTEVINHVWQYSHFNGARLIDCEELFHKGYYYASLETMFITLENALKSTIHSYDLSFIDVLKEVEQKNFFTKSEINFLNSKKFPSIRKLRNLFAHDSLSWKSVYFNNDKSRFYPLSEDTTHQKIYEEISPIIFNLIFKIISESKNINLDKKIQKTKFNIQHHSIEELLIFKGFPPDHLNNIEGSFEQKARMIDNAIYLKYASPYFK